MNTKHGAGDGLVRDPLPLPRRWMGVALLLVGQAIFVIPSWLARAVRSVVERDT
uniref:Uncharacterized protein n=1 Tax=uncultured bacterium A1Q1_fos_1050 TaxID=1256538 RepID=L7VXR5_9BACT|nr:hypothetical protein [uncultured bacterium A1Q1_fos_1050]